jgi:prenyltransferase beta subunit
MNAVYWGLAALFTMGHKDALDRDEMIDFVMSCWDEEAGLFPSRDPCHLELTFRRRFWRSS